MVARMKPGDIVDPIATTRSNLANWKSLQEADYFENHPIYQGLRAFTLRMPEMAVIQDFVPLTQDMEVVVVGCGYGRETLHIAPYVKHVYGIDVSKRILAKFTNYCAANGIHNCTPVLAERFKEDIPQDIDLVFSIVVMQHLTRDLVREYFLGLSAKLRPSGRLLVQFLEEQAPGQADADLRDYEPSISWTRSDLATLCEQSDLKLISIRTVRVAPTADWHWAFCSKPAKVEAA
jgi:SAM-dependent methyltransferase